MKIQTVPVNKYCRKVRKWLPCRKKEKIQILNIIRTTVVAYMEENPTADYAAIEQRFGTPQHIASTYIEETDTQESLSQMRIKRRVINIVAICAIVIVIIWIGFAAIALVDHHKAGNGYIEVEIITTEEMEE